MQLLGFIKDKFWPYSFYLLLIIYSASVVCIILILPETEKLLLMFYILSITVLAVFGFTNRKYVVEALVFPFLLVAILMPPLQLSPQLPHIRLEVYILSLLSLFIVLKKMVDRNYDELRTNGMIIWFVFFVIAVIASIGYSFLILGQDLIVRDFYEIIKIIIYFLFFTLFATLDFSNKQLIKIYGLVILLFIISALIGFAQYLDLGQINQLFSPHYAPTQAHRILDHHRITGTAYSPVEYGAIMVLAASIALANAFYYSKRNWKIYSWCSFFIFTLALIMTQARAAYIAYLVAVFVLIFYGLMKGIKSKEKLKSIMLAVLILGFILVIAIIIAPQEFFVRAQFMLNMPTDPSWQSRLVKWQEHISLWRESPIFGLGPDKTALTYNYVENEWLLVLRRYGLLGITAFIAFWVAFLGKLARIRRYVNSEEIIFLSIGLQSAICGYFLYMITLNLYHSMILIYILLILLGIAFSQDPRINKYRSFCRVVEK